MKYKQFVFQGVELTNIRGIEKLPRGSRKIKDGFWFLPDTYYGVWAIMRPVDGFKSRDRENKEDVNEAMIELHVIVDVSLPEGEQVYVKAAKKNCVLSEAGIMELELNRALVALVELEFDSTFEFTEEEE